VRELTRDAIRHFAWGIGDDNPLWLDREYAAHSRWGSLIAPPCFVYAVDETTVAPGFEERPRIYAAASWTWFDVLTLGRPLHATARAVEAEPSDAPESEETIVQTGNIEFDDARGRVLASVLTRCRRPAAGTARAIEPDPQYSDEQLEDIERAVLAEARRGGEARLWEDTRVGDTLAPLYKGPLSIMDIVAWCAATRGVEEQGDGASEGGLSSQTASGPQRVAWASHLLTHWMGDAGFLHRLEVELEGTAALGSTTSWEGAVTDRGVDSGASMIQIQLVSRNETGEVRGNGKALVMLESRERGAVQLPVAHQHAWLSE
jgi:acyl dehydratase